MHSSTFKSSFVFILFALFSASSLAGQVGVVARQADELVTILYRNAGRNIETVSIAARQADARMVENALRQFGPNARIAFEQGGYNLLRVGRDYGDDVFRIAARSPEAARLVSARTRETLNLAQRYGADAVTLEARIPGLLTKRAGLLRPREIRTLKGMTSTQQREIGRLVLRADSPATARKMVHSYQRRGGGFIAKIPTSYKVGGALVTGAVLDRAIFSDRGITGRIHEALKSTIGMILTWALMVFGTLWALRWAFCYTMRKFFKSPQKAPPAAPEGMKPSSANPQGSSE